MSLKFKVDENLPAEVATLLKDAGHDALTVADQMLAGSPDDDVLTVCGQEKRAMVTLDLGFADIRTYPPENHPGIVVFRLARLDKHRILSAARRLLPTVDQELLVGKLWIVDETSVRIRS